MKKIRILAERPGVGRLGRHVMHDERSRAYETVHAASPIVTASWERHCPPFNQGDIGSCTGNAMAGAAMTGNLWKPGRRLTEDDAVKIYSAATHIDGVAGAYPPDDTGSSGLAVAKVAARLGLIKAYHHAFGVKAALAALGHGPVIIGIGWYESFDKPVGAGALLQIGGEVRGGHEVELLAVDVDKQLVRGCNSWGDSWGDKGYFTMSFDTFGRLLAEDGDCVVPVV